MGAEIEIADSMRLTSSILYKDVLHIYYPQGISTYDYLIDMYYAKNTGLIRFKKNKDNSQWELIRSLIIQ